MFSGLYMVMYFFSTCHMKAVDLIAKTFCIYNHGYSAKDPLRGFLSDSSTPESEQSLVYAGLSRMVGSLWLPWLCFTCGLCVLPVWQSTSSGSHPVHFMALFMEIKACKQRRNWACQICLQMENEQG